MSKIKRALSVVVGTIADFAMPHLGSDMEAGRNTTQAVKLKRAIFQARMRRAHRSKDGDGLEDVLTSFWRSASGDKFHVDHGKESFERFLRDHAQVVDVLDQIAKASNPGFSRLVEIGCGDGWLTAYCTQKLSWVAQGIGIDINPPAIDRANASRPPGSRLNFVCADPREWLTANPQSGTVMVSNGGVLEYFSQEGFDDLLAALALARPAAILLLEPVHAAHDLERQPDSYSFNSGGWIGSESTFSHNHRVRLEKAGFEIAFCEATKFDHQPGMIVLGVRK